MIVRSSTSLTPRQLYHTMEYMHKHATEQRTIFSNCIICTDGDHNKTHVVIMIHHLLSTFEQTAIISANFIPVAFLIDCDFIEAHQYVNFIIELQSTKQLESICFRCWLHVFACESKCVCTYVGSVWVHRGCLCVCLTILLAFRQL